MFTTRLGMRMRWLVRRMPDIKQKKVRVDLRGKGGRGRRKKKNRRRVGGMECAKGLYSGDLF